MLLTDHRKTALILPDRSLTYADLLGRARAMAQLIPAGTERVLIFSENRAEWIVALYAAWSAGCTVVPVDFQATAGELGFIVRDCRPRFCFCSQARQAVLAEALAGLEDMPPAAIFEELGSGELAAAEPIGCPDAQATALLIYTSGTTGMPKGVMLSFANILANVEAVTVGTPIYGPEERVLMFLPLHHIFPLLGTVVMPLSVGATVAQSPSLKAEDIVATLQGNKITLIIGVPRFYNLIVQSIRKKIEASALAGQLYRLAERAASPRLSRLLFSAVHKKFGGHLKYLISGGAALDPEVGRQFTTLGFEILEGYGMTEAAPMISFTRPGQVCIGSAGKAMSCTTIAIHDGEILAKGRNIMQGYWNRPEETAEVLRDGWLHTGDLGHLDDQGRLFVTGRKKEILVLANGKNINPALIEQELEALDPAIAETGVLIKDDLLQVVIRPNLAVLREKGISRLDDYFRWQVIDRYNHKVSPAKRLHRFTLVERELPRTRLDKLKRFQLPSLVLARQERPARVEHPAGEEYRLIHTFLEGQIARAVAPDDHLEIDAALDSLDKVSLLVYIQKTFGVEIAEEDLMRLPTLRQLSGHVAERKEKIAEEPINWRDILREQLDSRLPRAWFTTNLIKNASRLLLGCYFRFRTEGRENIPDTPCIIAPNHQSFIDGLLVAAGLKNTLMRRTCFYAKAKHVRNRWLRFLADRNNVVVMDINTDVRESIQKVALLLRGGKNVIIFPEGTRTLNGALGEFKKTFAILSKELNVPVVPVAIRGAFEALPAGSRLPLPFRRISVRFQPPIFPDGHSYESLKELVQEQIRQCLDATSPSLLPQGENRSC
ncbi:AMP-binding protein [Desulfobulbus sp.]|uniref:AMP-binding protein n=1 Tax=Desulfobulbus sp. TaxID=895 RepID=UPI00286F14E3|nr:AMP-binding protein [Desulfobulbus sp.]